MSRCIVCGQPFSEAELTLCREAAAKGATGGATEGAAEGSAAIHTHCARKVFRVPYLPECPYTLQQLIDEALRLDPSQAGSNVLSLKLAITDESEERRAAFCLGGSGADYTLSVVNSPDRDDLKVAVVVQRMAAAAHLNIAPWALVETLDGATALVQLQTQFGRRRVALPQKSIAEILREETENSAQTTATPQTHASVQIDPSSQSPNIEAVAALVASHTTAAKLEVINLYEALYFCWMIGCNSLTINNIYLVTKPDGFTTLAPLGSLTSTLLLSCSSDDNGDTAPFTIASKQSDINADDFTKSMLSSGVSQKVAENMIAKFSALIDRWCDIIEEADLSEEMSERLKFALFIKG